MSGSVFNAKVSSSTTINNWRAFLNLDKITIVVGRVISVVVVVYIIYKKK